MTQISGEIQACCHRVDYYFDVGQTTGSDLAKRCEDEADSRSREMIAQECVAGDLCFIYLDDDGNEHELHGSWRIKDVCL